MAVTPGLFRGWVRTSLAEYPGRVATVPFTGGCTFRCPFCYNADLVLRPALLPRFTAEEVLLRLASLRGRVSALLVSGGEPTMHPWLGGFLREVKRLGVAAGIATNGGEPERLSSLLADGLLDWVAMDVKTVLEPDAYAVASGTGDPGLAARVRRSVDCLRGSGVDYELRCTAVPSLHSAGTLVALAAALRGSRRLVFQQFQPGSCLAESFDQLPPFPLAELLAARDAAAGLVGECLVRAPLAPGGCGERAGGRAEAPRPPPSAAQPAGRGAPILDTDAGNRGRIGRYD